MGKFKSWARGWPLAQPRQLAFQQLEAPTTAKLAFLRGNELSNEQGLLLFKDRKQVGGIDLMVENIPIKQVKEVIQEAIELDHAIAYASKRKKK
jgi:hypothetical protein